MSMQEHKKYVIEYVEDPAAFFEAHAGELAAVGADAFGQTPDEFAPQIEERFHKAGLAQAMNCGGSIVGFALYDVLRGSHWRPAFD